MQFQDLLVAGRITGINMVSCLPVWIVGDTQSTAVDGQYIRHGNVQGRDLDTELARNIESTIQAAAAGDGPKGFLYIDSDIESTQQAGQIR